MSGCFRWAPGEGRVSKPVLASAAVLMLLAASASAQNSIDTIAGWNGTSSISSFGVVNTATYGETITVGAGASPLNSFSFEIGHCSAGVTFRGEVYAWDGTKATGSSLFESPTMTVPADSSFHLVTINVGGISLAPGTYVLFASTSKDQDMAPNAGCQWGALTNNTGYAGGQFVYLNNGPLPAQWTTNIWSNIGRGPGVPGQWFSDFFRLSLRRACGVDDKPADRLCGLNRSGTLPDVPAATTERSSDLASLTQAFHVHFSEPGTSATRGPWRVLHSIKIQESAPCLYRRDRFAVGHCCAWK